MPAEFSLALIAVPDFSPAFDAVVVVGGTVVAASFCGVLAGTGLELDVTVDGFGTCGRAVVGGSATTLAGSATGAAGGTGALAVVAVKDGLEVVVTSALES